MFDVRPGNLFAHQSRYRILLIFFPLVPYFSTGFYRTVFPSAQFFSFKETVFQISALELRYSPHEISW